MTAINPRPGESPEGRQAKMLTGYLRWQNATLAHASGDPLPLVTAAARVALTTAEAIAENGSTPAATRDEG